MDSELDQRLSRLMVESQAGEKTAYAELLSEIQTLMMPFILKRVSKREQAEEVLQELLISIHKARQTYDGRRPFLPWCFAIARFRVADFLRISMREMENEILDEEILLSTPDLVGSEIHFEIEIDGALNELPATQSNIVRMLKIEGLAIKEVAQKLSMSEGAVKVAAHRAYKALKEILEKKDHGNR